MAWLTPKKVPPESRDFRVCPRRRNHRASRPLTVPGCTRLVSMFLVNEHW